MGYYATGSGTIYLKSTAPEAALSRVRDTMEGVKCEKCGKAEAQAVGIPEGSMSVSVWDSDKYWSDAIAEMLDFLEPYTLCGNIRYVGEDDVLWEFLFDSKTGEWREDCPNIPWPSDMFDRAYVLMAELASGSTLSYTTRAKNAKAGLEDFISSLAMVGVNTEDLAVTKAVLRSKEGKVLDEYREEEIQ